MILDLHMGTAAPGWYPNQKIFKKIRTRNIGLSKLSTFASTKMFSNTHISTRMGDCSNMITSENNEKEIGGRVHMLNEGEWLFRTSLHSIVDEGNDDSF